jgi:hypothetical protein
MRTKHLLLLFTALWLNHVHGRNVEHTREAWMDSVIAEGVQKIAEAESWQKSSRAQPQQDWITGETYGSHLIVIDAAQWTPVISANQFYYEKATLGYITPGERYIVDSVNAANWYYANRSDYVAYYNIIILNLPFPLEKDLSSTGNTTSQSMFAQLQALGYIDNQKYYDATWKLKDIIDGVVSQAMSFSSQRIICYGIAGMTGQYANEPRARAAFACEYIGHTGVDTTLPWVRQVLNIPKLMHSPYSGGNPPTLREKNNQVSMAVRNFILCNQYGVCIEDAGVFSNAYARWLYSELSNAYNIDKQLLFSTCLEINQLSLEMAWSVITANYENAYTCYNTQIPSGLVYRNTTLDTIRGLVVSIRRGADQFRTNTDITRDSALYFGRLLYRIPAYITGIDTRQKVRLLKIISSQVCSDITSVTSPSDYANHCERVCKALYTYVPEPEIRLFMDELKSSGAIWDLTYKLDNQFLGFFGNDNYTDFIFTISAYWKKAYPALASGTSGYVAIKWTSDYFNSNTAVQSRPAQNQMLFAQQKRVGWQYFGANVTDSVFAADIYSPVIIHVNEGSFIPDLPGVKDLTVPAIFMDWLSHKKMLDDAATTARVTLAVAALATGVGEFITAATVTMRVISAVEIAVSASDLVLLSDQVRLGVIGLFPTPQEGEQFLASYERITMMINLSVAAKGLVQTLDYDIAQYISRFDDQQPALRTLLGENSAEYRGMEKLREEIGMAKSANSLLDGLAPHLKAIHDRLELAGVRFEFEGNSIIYYGSQNNIPFELGKIENGDFIVTPAKGAIPNYTCYLNSSYTAHHLAKFQLEGGGFIIRKRDIIATEHNNLAPRKFCGLKSEMDLIIAKYHLSGSDLNVLTENLDLGNNYFLPDDEVYYIIVTPNRGFIFDIPNGNEIGAYQGFWVPGGYTKHGAAEAVIQNTSSFPHNKSWETFVNIFGSDNVIKL